MKYKFLFTTKQQNSFNVYATRLSFGDETLDHLETLLETGSLKEKELYDNLHCRIETLGKKLNRFIQSIEKDLKQAASRKKLAARNK